MVHCIAVRIIINYRFAVDGRGRIISCENNSSHSCVLSTGRTNNGFVV